MWLVKKADPLKGSLYYGGTNVVRPGSSSISDCWWHQQSYAARYVDHGEARRAALRVQGYVVRLRAPEAPRHGAAVHLTIEEARALRAAVMGDFFDQPVMNSALAQIDQADSRASLQVSEVKRGE